MCWCWGVGGEEHGMIKPLQPRCSASWSGGFAVFGPCVLKKEGSRMSLPSLGSHYGSAFPPLPSAQRVSPSGLQPILRVRSENGQGQLVWVLILTVLQGDLGQTPHLVLPGHQCKER